MGCSTCGKGPRLTPVDPHKPEVSSDSTVKRYRLRPLRVKQQEAKMVPAPPKFESPIAEEMAERGMQLGMTKPPGISSVEKEDIET